ncbi:MAG: hypothetical protein RDV41_04585 [Planctomycetota bacterium]|nr:hypothetical protein [Planctomycetota bacterium]
MDKTLAVVAKAFSLALVMVMICSSTAICQDKEDEKSKGMCEQCVKDSLGSLLENPNIVVTKTPCLLCRKGDVNPLLQGKICEACAKAEGICLRCLMPMEAGWPKALDEVATPAADKIVFISDRDGENEVFIMDGDGKNPTQLTFNGANDLDPAVSPDGKFIVFTSKLDKQWDLYLTDIEGKHLRRLTRSGEPELSACWFPDGQRLLFMLQEPAGLSLCAIARDGSEMKALELPEEYKGKAVGFPDISPDGKKIAFVAGEGKAGATWEICVRDEKGEVAQLTKNKVFDSAPCWSPDGKKILYVSNSDLSKEFETDEVWVMDSNGKNAKQLTKNSFLDSNPRWSGDGKKVVFITCRDKAKEGVADIYAMDVSGKNPTNLTKAATKETSPRWVKGASGKKK